MNDVVKQIEKVISTDLIKRVIPGVSPVAFCPESGTWVLLNCDPYPELYSYVLIRLPNGWRFQSQ